MAKGEFSIQGRIAGLNAWRAALMLGGLLVHGSVLSEHLRLFEGMAWISAAFRMGAFFAISGMLAALVMTRRRPIDWFGKQSVRVGVPALFGILALSPIIAAIMRGAIDPAQAAGIALFDWHHLWFLFALLLYQPIAYLLFMRIDRRRSARLLRWLCAQGQTRVLTVMSAVSLVLTGMALKATFDFAPEAHWSMLLQLGSIIGYMPLYFLGFLLGLSRAFRVTMLGTVAVPITILALAAAAALLCFIAEPVAGNDWDGTMRWLLSVVCPPAAAALILRSALTTRQVPPVMDRLCAASFTIYMLHYPVLVAINAAARPWGVNPYLQYAAAVSFTAVFCYALHFRLVERSPALSLLLNGRLPEVRRVAVATA